jgi:hypothetical protein
MQTITDQEAPRERFEAMSLDQIAAAYVANTDAIASLNVFMPDFEARLQVLTAERVALRQELFQRTSRPRRSAATLDASGGHTWSDLADF